MGQRSERGISVASMTERRIFADPASLAEGAAAEFLSRAAEATRDRGRFIVALSGGSTPRAAYAAIARRSGECDWRAVHVLWGDERCVPPDDPKSNFRMAREAFLGRVPIPAENVHRWLAELPPAEAADDYTRRIEALAGSPPVLDLAFLGVGGDGHTASLFPGSAALALADRSAVANFAPSLGEWRLTLTFPVFDAARAAVFLAEGEEKRGVLRRIAAGDDLPAARVRAAETLWFVDRAAAGG